MGDPDMQHAVDPALAELLAWPARCQAGGLAPRSRLGLSRVLRRAEQALRRCLDLPAQIRIPTPIRIPAPIEVAGPMPSETPSETQCSFAAVFVLGQAEWSVLLDEVACRALLDVIEQSLSGHLARAEIDEVEQGLLEGLALLLLGELSRGSAPSDEHTLEWKSCLHGESAAQYAATLEDAPLPIEISAAGRRVTVRVHGHGSDEIATALDSLELPDSRMAPLACSLELHARIEGLAPAELDALRAASARGSAAHRGSLLLLGAGDWNELASRMELRSSTGWRLGTAKLEQPRPHVLRAALLALQLEPADASTASLQFGATPLHESELTALCSGASFAFPRSGSMQLNIDGATQLPVELVDYDGEFAARIL
jgi:hypothetical protein